MQQQVALNLEKSAGCSKFRETFLTYQASTTQAGHLTSVVGRAEPGTKDLETMRKFSEQYARR